MVLAPARTENLKVCECTEYQRLLQMPMIQLNLSQIGPQEELYMLRVFYCNKKGEEQ